MEACCSFKSIVGGICGFDLKDRKQSTQIIPLITCIKDISKHKTTYNFSGIENEIDLILCRAGLFSEAGRLSQSLTICPRHRSTLGLGWSRGASTRCRVPESISKHGKGKGGWSKGERGLGKLESAVVFRQTGLLVPVGSGICRKCRGILKPMVESKEHNINPSGIKVDALTDQMHDVKLDDDEIPFNLQRETSILDTLHSCMTELDDPQTSLYQPTEISMNLSGEEDRENCDMGSRANLLVTELWDTELIGEGALPTLRDACQRLLEPGFVCIPAAGTIYTQVFTCKVLWEMHQLDQDKMPGGAQIKLPGNMTECLGTTSAFDLHLDEIHDHEIEFLSKPIPVLRFDFCENKLKPNCSNIFSIPNSTSSVKASKSKEAQYYDNTIATMSGVAHGVVMWWLLDMDVEGKITLETTPRWAHPDGNKCQWRDHWMQAVYYLKKPLPIKQGEELNVYCCHDEYSLWFDVQHKQSIPSKVERPICTCGAHITWSRHRFCMFNDKKINSVFQAALKKLVKSGCSSTFCVSDKSLLPVAAAKAGFKEVLTLESSISFTKLLQQILRVNDLSDRVCLLDKALQNICKDDLPEGKIDAVIGEPFFNSSLLPWHNLYFWYALTTLRQLVKSDVKVMPQGGILRGIAVEFKDLWKYHSPVDTVEGFDLSLFDQLIEKSKLKNEEIDGDSETCIALEPHHVWEYPCKPLTEVISLMDFDFSKPIPENTVKNSGIMPITGLGTLHCVVLWMDFHVMDDVYLTNGLTKNVKITRNDTLDWVRHTKQGVYFMRSPTIIDEKASYDTNLAYSVTFEPSQGDVKLNFQVK